MNKEIIAFVDIEIGKSKFYYFKYPININNKNINTITVSDKISVNKNCFKYFIGYKDDKNVKPLCILLIQKRVHGQEILMKLNVCLFLTKDDE